MTGENPRGQAAGTGKRRPFPVPSGTGAQG